MAYLYRIRPDGTAIERWEVGTEPLVMGRGESASAFVEDDALSRSHFLIVNEGADYIVVDLHSRNGTWVGGTRVKAHKLLSDEIILAGESLFCFSTKPPSSFVIPNPAAAIQSRQSAAARA